MARCIPDFLSTNPPLETLYLVGNRLNDDDALNIAQALQSNTNLRVLDLGNNSLTEKGKTTMYHQSLFGKSEGSKLNLNTASGANHTCMILGISEPNAFMNYSSTSAKLNRGRKLFYLLSNRYRKGYSITQLEMEFSEDGMGIVPHVLACVNTYSADYK